MKCKGPEIAIQLWGKKYKTGVLTWPYLKSYYETIAIFEKLWYWHKKGQTDKWNRTEFGYWPIEYGKLTFDKSAKWKFSGESISSVQSLSCVRLFATPWIAARQASLSINNSQSSLRLTSIKSVMPSSHLILCRPLLLLPPIPPSIRVFSNESTLRMR